MSVGKPPFVEQLEQDVEHVGVRLLDLVEQQDAVRAAADDLRELTAFVVTDVTRRCADEARHGVPLLVLAHVDADERALVVEEELGQRARELGLPHAGRAEEDERSDGTVRVRQAAARAADRVRYRFDRVVLSDDPAVEVLLHMHELRDLAFHQLGHGDPGPFADHLGDVFFVDLFFQVALLGLQCVPRCGRFLEALLERDERAVTQLCGAIEVAFALGHLGLQPSVLDPLLQLADARHRRLLLQPVCLHRRRPLLQLGQFRLELVQPLLRCGIGLFLQSGTLDLHALHLAVDLVELRRHRIDLDAKAARGLVDQVDGLVRQEAPGHVPMRKQGGGDQRGVGDANAVVHLIAFLQATKDRDRVFDARLADQDRLEATLEGRVLLDVLAILVERRRSDETELAAREHRLDHVAGVHRAFRSAGADDGVQLVDERDDLAFRLGDLLQDGLEPLFELAAEPRARDQRAEVQRNHPLVLQAFRHIPGHDPLGEALDDRRLADPGLADKDGVVLRPARQHLDDTANLVVTSDDRVELPFPGQLGEVAPVLLERLVRALRRLAGDALIAAHFLQHAQHSVARDAVLFQQARDRAGDVRQREQQVLGRDILVGQRSRLFVRTLEHAHERGRSEPRLFGRVDLRKAIDQRRDAIAKRARRDAELLHDGEDDAGWIREQRIEQVLGLDGLMRPLRGNLLCRHNGFL